MTADSMGVDVVTAVATLPLPLRLMPLTAVVF